MRQSSLHSIVLCVPLFLSACASKDHDYERAMRDWATKTCECCRLDGDEANKCIDALGGEPAFPEHFLDAMIDNPNHEIAQRFSQQTRGCCTRK